MVAKLSLAAAFLLMAGAPLAGASQSARPNAISALHSSISASIVVAQNDQSSDSADSDSDSSDSDSDSESSDSAQSAGNDQADQDGAAQGSQAPDSDAGEAGQVPLNAYPQQVNPNQ